MTEKSLKYLDSLPRVGGLQEGLRYLNSRVGHRFTAVYRRDGAMLQAVEFFDRGNDGYRTAALQRLHLDDSFCRFAMRDGYFRTSRSTGMKMLQGHRLQGVLESYVGLPLMRNPREFFGTLCHFDLHEQPLSDDEFSFFQRASHSMLAYLQDTGLA